MLRKIAIYFVLILVSCLEPYEAKDGDAPQNVLVIDGFIDVNSSSAKVKLSRLANITADNNGLPQSAGHVYVEDESGKRTTLVEGTKGNYTVTIPGLQPDTKYKLVVNVSDEERYESDFVNVEKTPAIDSLSWDAGEDGVRIYVNTHSSSKNAKFYYWEFIETWCYTAPLESTLKRDGRAILHRTSLDNIFVCYKTVPSTNINVFSTQSLSGNVVSRRQIQFLPKGSQKVSVRYSIEVKQRLITGSEYEYLRLLKQTTESLGGLFDPLPAQTTSNVKSVGPNPNPAGFFSGSSTETDRIYISFYDLPDDLKVQQMHDCVPELVCASRIASPGCLRDLESLAETDLLITDFEEGYLKTSWDCADCRAQGGSLNPPAFWIPR